MGISLLCSMSLEETIAIKDPESSVEDGEEVGPGIDTEKSKISK